MAASSKEGPSAGMGLMKDLFLRVRGTDEWNQAVVLSRTSASDSMGSINRQELVTKLISTCIGLAASLTVTYFGFKYLSNVLDPTRQEKKEQQKRAEQLLKSIGVAGVKLTEYELCIAANLVDPLTMSVTWQDIGGLDEYIQEIKETVILPFKRHELFSGSQLIQPPKGVLLYGPPGCGKTMIAKATAKAAGARFINLQVSALVDKWYGESQKRAEAVFSLAIKLQPTIIFIDEIDSFLRARTSSDHEATNMMKTQFMSFWDGLITDPKCRVMIMGATNRAHDVDSAILRRMPSMFRIGLPSPSQRRHILSLILKDETMAYDIDLKKVANETEGFSGSDLRELCRNAALVKVREYIRNDGQRLEDDEAEVPTSLRPMQMSDLDTAVGKMKENRGVRNLASSLHQVDLD